MADFLDKFVAGVNKGVKNIKTNSDLFVEKAEIKSQISQLSRQKNDVAAAMGHFVYNLYKSGEVTDNRLVNMLGEMAACDSKLEELNKKLEDIARAGAQQDEPAYGEGEFVYCPSCGVKCRVGSLFCGSCGSPINTAKEE